MASETKMPTVKRLGGVYLARWNQNQWIQWPIGREPTIDDAFGWVTPEMVREVVAIWRQELAEAGEGEEEK